MSSGYFVAFCAFCALMPLMVLSEEDKHPPTCADPDEQYYYECAPICNNTCENHNKSKVDCTDQCVFGCFCRPGLLKRNDGKCVKPRDCPIDHPSCADPDEQYYECTPDCTNTCENYNKSNVVCPAICKTGCFCREGLVKRKDGKCVDPRDCPRNAPTCAHPDEQFYRCIPDCENTCENYDRHDVLCPAVCVPDCFCRVELVKRKDGKCVEPRNCTRNVCGINEEIVECSKPKWCNTCEIRGNCKLAECEKGCDCKKGYFRNDYGVCAIPEDQCETCGENEQYDICGPLCQQSCDTLAADVLCIRGCEAGCFCRKGYVRDKDNNCIPASKCPPDSCPKKEEPSDCVVPCNDCEIRGRCNFIACNPGCDCKKDYYRNSNGRCIPEKKCPTECPPNEEMSTCQTPCTACKYQAKGCPIKVPCKTGCECKQGFARTVAGRCVPIEDCTN